MGEIFSETPYHTVDEEMYRFFLRQKIVCVRRKAENVFMWEEGTKVGREPTKLTWVQF